MKEWRILGYSLLIVAAVGVTLGLVARLWLMVGASSAVWFLAAWALTRKRA
jgi:type IV secretory pathway TrbD component